MSAEKHSGRGKYQFSLYIDSEKPKYSAVADRLHQLCQQYLSGSYTIEVIDLREDQLLMERLHIIAVPTLDVTTSQSTTHRFVGDLSQSEVFIIALGMGRKADQMTKEASEMGRLATKMRDKIQFP